MGWTDSPVDRSFSLHFEASPGPTLFDSLYPIWSRVYQEQYLRADPGITLECGPPQNKEKNPRKQNKSK